jgi:hypothetical protein
MLPHHLETRQTTNCRNFGAFGARMTLFFLVYGVTDLAECKLSQNSRPASDDWGWKKQADIIDNIGG